MQWNDDLFRGNHRLGNTVSLNENALEIVVVKGRWKIYILHPNTSMTTVKNENEMS